ncbi:MAG TPA: hypothetical protein PLV13_10135, partial [Ilumatobacteraceae bacterium]|nr:hypothetical protein [Ilumatobacteraceae bacterium]
LNSQIQRWAQQHPGRVEVLPYTAPLLAYEAEHGWIREDGSHPDVDLLTGILRDAVVPVLLDRISAAR